MNRTHILTFIIPTTRDEALHAMETAVNSVDENDMATIDGIVRFLSGFHEFNSKFISDELSMYLGSQSSNMANIDHLMRIRWFIRAFDALGLLEDFCLRNKDALYNAYTQYRTDIQVRAPRCRADCHVRARLFRETIDRMVSAALERSLESSRSVRPVKELS